jgi:hypothetical protein
MRELRLKFNLQRSVREITPAKDLLVCVAGRHQYGTLLTINASIEGVACSNGSVDNLLQRTGLGIVVHDYLDGSRVHMVHLLLRKAEGRRTCNDTIVLFAPALDLAHGLAATVGTPLKVGINLLGAVAVESLSKGLANLVQLAQCCVGKGVCSVPVDGSVAIKNNLIIGAVESIVSG